jgi:hypothetical protein
MFGMGLYMNEPTQELSRASIPLQCNVSSLLRILYENNLIPPDWTGPHGEKEAFYCWAWNQQGEEEREGTVWGGAASQEIVPALVFVRFGTIAMGGCLGINTTVVANIVDEGFSKFSWIDVSTATS